MTHLAIWSVIAVTGGLTLALRLLPLLARRRMTGEISPTMDRFNRAFLACCIASMVVGLLLPAGISPLSGGWHREATLVGVIALYLAISRFYDGLLLAPALALAFVAVRTYFP
ncbi:MULTISPECIES: hypothetical protein [Burkholderia]|uniref:hypothetical protein n=1 Tax=Burkholderia TaxID=32008 RepID=UPI000B7A5392|nr:MULTISPECIES: hypothetical protein [Burkholderia]OXJ02656.1 hypothetical protein CFB41_06785 [Burkholderia sp. AU33803]PRD90368.1 hypothetical protein C6P88_23005 [Burkholderia contaminans]